LSSTKRVEGENTISGARNKKGNVIGGREKRNRLRYPERKGGREREGPTEQVEWTTNE